MTIRYRALSPTGDYTFGHAPSNFLVDSPQAVGQLVKTRLLLAQGEWFLDVTEGTPWVGQVLGERTKPLYDLAIQARVLSTPNVLSIDSYLSTLNANARSLAVVMTISTSFGKQPVQAVV